MIRASALATGVLVALAGCFPQQTTSRSQVADDTADQEAFATIGDKTVIGNVEPIPVAGVGLVTTSAGPAAYRPRTAGGRSSNRRSAVPRAIPEACSTIRIKRLLWSSSRRRFRPAHGPATACPYQSACRPAARRPA